MNFGFTQEQQHLIERLNALVKDRIAAQIVGAAELGEPFDTNRNH
jgi:hypothetical protein